MKSIYQGIFGGKALAAFDKKSGRKSPSPPCEVDIREILEKAASAQHGSREDDFKFHCSGLHDCSRNYYWNWKFGKPNNKKGKFSLKGIFAVMLGKLVHELLEALMAVAAKIKLIKSFEPEVYLQSVKHNLAGSCDGILTTLNGKKYILEFKSTNMRSYEKFMEEPKHDHKTQLQMYLFMTGIEKGYIVYFNKDDAEITSHEIVASPAYQQRVLDRLGYIQYCVDNNTPPAEHLSCTDLSDLNKSCPNYLRCKNWETKRVQPTKETGMTRERFLKMKAEQGTEIDAQNKGSEEIKEG